MRRSSINCAAKCAIPTACCRTPSTPCASSWRPSMAIKKTGTAKAPGRLKLFREMELLLSLSRQVAEAADLDAVLRIIVTTAAAETHADRGTLFLHDDQTGELYSRVAQGSRVREIRILNTTGIAGHVFKTGQPLI